MTPFDIERLAQQAEVWAIPGTLLPPSKVHNERLARFAALVLEEAAKTSEGYATMEGYEREIAAAIRAMKPVAS